MSTKTEIAWCDHTFGEERSDRVRLNGIIETIHYGDPKKTKLEIAFALDAEQVKELVDLRGQMLVWHVEPVQRGLFDGPREPAPLGEYLIDGVFYPIQEDRRKMTGAELRDIAGLEPDASLWETFGGEDAGTYGLVEPTATIDIFYGLRLVSTLGEQDSAPDDSPEEGDAELAQDLAATAMPVGANGRSGAE